MEPRWKGKNIVLSSLSQDLKSILHDAYGNKLSNEFLERDNENKI